MKENPENTVSFCFDLQQVQVLPKVPIQDAFYSQQLAFYNFCITKTNCQDPVFYTWLEFQAGRGATETSSALLHFLKSEVLPADVNTIRLFSDGCGGQNKNSHVIHMLMLWLSKFAPESITSVELIFPIRGHSYLPADRIFGRLEKITRRYSTIKNPEKYYEIYAKVGEVRKLGQEWSLIDIKKATGCLKKVKGISSCKRIFLKKKRDNVLIKTENLYRFNDPSKKFESLLKPRKRLQSVNTPPVPLTHKIKKKKLDSIKKLLVSLSGEEWPDDPELRWMVPIFSESYEAKDEENIVNESEEECECNDAEEINLI